MLPLELNPPAYPECRPIIGSYELRSTRGLDPMNQPHRSDLPAVSHRNSSRPNGSRSFIAEIPHRKIRQMGKLLGWCIYACDARHRRIVRRNLKFAFPEWTWQRVHRVTRQVFENFGIAVLEIIQVNCFSRDQIQSTARIEGEEQIKHLLADKGLIIVSGHLGNWELALLFAASHLRDRVFAIARKIDFKPLDRWVYRFRTRFGGEVVNKKGALPDMTRAVRGGRVLATLIDQGTMRGEGIDATFFNHKVLATPGVAMLAMRAKVSVMPAFCVREENGFKIIMGKPLEMQRTKNLRHDIRANTQKIMDAIEEAVRKYPEQYFWFHKRWKIYYPHLYREDLERLRRRRKKHKLKPV
jgi:KDO2-lipid IV(A) lauroyltransferase